MHSLVYNCVGFVIVFLPLLLFRLFAKESQPEFFGLRPKGFNVKPYFILLLIMLPIIIMVSFEKSFADYYPTYHNHAISPASVVNWPAFFPAIIYEFFYGADFLNVELLFRGFMVIGLSKILGKEAVMPMVVTYCFLHFGKPVGEAISAMVGGYILGVIALETRSIWGGVIVHVGIAWMMELVAYLQDA